MTGNRLAHALSSRWLSAALVCSLATTGFVHAAGDDEPADELCDFSDTDKFGEGVNWANNLEEALERGKKEDKPVLIAFSSLRQEPGCGGEHDY